MADPAVPRQTTTTGQSPSAERLLAERLLAVSMESTFAGPLPPPGLIKGYEEVCPGAAQRIIAMAEAQGKHRRQIEEKMGSGNMEGMRLQFKENRRGQYCAVSVAIAFLAAGVYVAVNGNPWPGALLGGLGGGGMGLHAIVNAFLRRGESADDQKSQPAQPPVSPRKRKR
jgi:uncharacterized membrane protein